MKLGHFISVVFATIIAVLIGIVLLSNQRGEQSLEQKLLIDDFDFDSVHKVTIQSQNRMVEMNRRMTSWQVNEFFNYQADVELLSELLRQIKTASIQEYKTTNSNNYHRLGLSGVEVEGSEATLISLITNEREVNVLLGNKAKSGFGQYAKLAGSKQTYLLDTHITVKSDPKAWLEKRIFAYHFEQIRRLNWLDNEGAAFSIERKEQMATGELEVKDGQPVFPTGKVKLKPEFELVSPLDEGKLEPMYESVFTGLARNTHQLELQGVSPRLEAKLPEQSAIYTIELVTQQDGMKSTSVLRFYQTAADQYWLVIEGEEWAYQISEFSFKQLGKPVQDYLAE